MIQSSLSQNLFLQSLAIVLHHAPKIKEAIVALRNATTIDSKLTYFIISTLYMFKLQPQQQQHKPCWEKTVTYRL